MQTHVCYRCENARYSRVLFFYVNALILSVGIKEIRPRLLSVGKARIKKQVMGIDEYNMTYIQ